MVVEFPGKDHRVFAHSLESAYDEWEIFLMGKDGEWDETPLKWGQETVSWPRDHLKKVHNGGTLHIVRDSDNKDEIQKIKSKALAKLNRVQYSAMGRNRQFLYLDAQKPEEEES